MWPTPQKRFYGIFVEEQVNALKTYYPEIKNQIWFIRGYKSKFHYLWSVIQLNWHLLFHSYDIIHLHSALSGVFLLFMPKRNNVIITLHGTDILGSKQFCITKYIIRKATHLICVSPEIQSIVEPINNNTCVIPCAVRCLFFGDERKKENLQTIRVIFPSSKKRKVKNFPLFNVIIAQMQALFQEKIEIVELDNKSRTEVRDELNKADFLLLTSFHEGSPQIIKEAMCCNTPVISANVGNVMELLKDVENCFVVDGYNPNEYVAKIVLLFNQNKNFPIRTSGRNKIYNLKYDEKSVSINIINLYRTISSFSS